MNCDSCKFEEINEEGKNFETSEERKNIRRVIEENIEDLMKDEKGGEAHRKKLTR